MSRRATHNQLLCAIFLNTTKIVTNRSTQRLLRQLDRNFHDESIRSGGCKCRRRLILAGFWLTQNEEEQERQQQSEKMWGKNSSKNDVEVEVSLDVMDNLYSIVVTEGAKLQSVVSVPTASRNRTSRRRFLGGGIMKKNSSDELTARMASSTSQRLADSLRPLSPNMNDRHSALEDSSRGRGRGLSCPPSVDRSNHSEPDTQRQRLRSCPPNGRHGRDEREPSSSSSKVRSPRSSRRTSSNSKKPNLVSKAASRNRLFGGGKRKIIPESTTPIH